MKHATCVIENNLIYLERFETKLGTMFAAATGKGLCLLEFTDRKILETEFKDLKKRFATDIVMGRNAHIDKTIVEMDEYFEGKRKTFSVDLDIAGTDFQIQVWDELKKIPFGQSCSYLKLAARVGKPTAVRAVANANGMNKICIIVPCHRVIGTDGKLTGYGGGLERKKWLLELEKSNA